MNSKIALLKIQHARLFPKEHKFAYHHYSYLYDLDELTKLDKKIKLFNLNSFNISSLHEKDYLLPTNKILKQKIITLLNENGFNTKVTRIELLTSARYFNHAFNPINIYYCYNNNDLYTIVAEVNNTFGDKHVYLLNIQKNQVNKGTIKADHDKTFFVSPFNKVEGEYTFSFLKKRDSLHIHIKYFVDNREKFNATLHAQLLDFSNKNHIKTILQYSLSPFKTIPRIHWQAIKMFFLRRISMEDRLIPTDPKTIIRRKASRVQKLYKKLVIKTLKKIDRGYLTVQLPDNSIVHFGKKTKQVSDNALIQIYDYKFFNRIVFSGDVGLGEAFVQGEWDSPDTKNFIALLIRNRNKLKNGEYITSKLFELIDYLAFLKRKNSPSGSKKNIGEHYDLSNQFFECFLDKSMCYSSGIFLKKTDSSLQSQKNKMYALIEKAQINKNDHVLEIGCGWGGFAIEMVKKTGCKVTGITVSKEQYTYALDRIKKEKLGKKITIKLADYRSIKGKFDKIVSVEMLEAVGHNYFGTFFKSCDQLLKENGLIAIQVITIPDQRYKDYLKKCDWIQKYIFPGGVLPSLTELTKTMTKNSSLIVEKLDNIGPHYAKTLNLWRKRYLENIKKIDQLGFDSEFHKKWIYYLELCEAGFETRSLNNLHLILTRENNNSIK